MKTFFINKKCLIKYEINNKIFTKILFLLLFLINIDKFKTNPNKIIGNKNKNIINRLNLDLYSQKYYLFKFIKNYEDKNHYFNITYFNYSYIFKYNIVKVEYNIGFYDENNNNIIPSDLTLYHNLNILCHVKKFKKNTNIESLANIYNNQYYNCIEFINMNDKLKFGIIINSQVNNELYIIYLFNDKIINYNNLYNKYKEYSPLIKNKKSKTLIQKFLKINVTNEKIKLTNLFFSIKEKAIVNINKWQFINVNNHYFCSCKGSKCIYKEISDLCKFDFYLTIIDNNKNIYNKTHYLLADFIYMNYSSDDTFPIFEEMIKLNLSAHYMTEKIDIYNKYCKNKKKCLSILLVNSKNLVINGNFLERYLTLLLKLKATISGAKFFYTKNLFYNIDYITHICVGHGIAILKQFLYSGHNYYGYKRYNKILLPPSEKIISIAKKHGWTDDNIIKINLPKWDKYNNSNENLSSFKEKIKRNSIFVMFTWRQIKAHKTISNDYINNILKLINNYKLNKVLTKKNITLYFTLHHKVKKFKKKFKTNKFVKYIIENDIFECLSKTSLVVTDFSSIMFDMICRGKPYIIFIPDANDPYIKKIYKNNYYKTIKLIKQKSINFINQYFDLNETIKKIFYYINNNFKLEKKIKKFYKSFSFKAGNNTKEFIEYLEKMK